jgi:glycosyltransferase involved in cell wall biosynthesis
VTNSEACPLVSVVIPTYNRATIIIKTIDNVLEQTYPNIEIIIVDDGSTDDTSERLRTYGDKIQVIRQANAGAAAARNRGIEAARGEFVALQDSDDLWLPEKLSRQVALLRRAGESAGCCFCNALLSRADGRKQTAFEEAWLFPPYSEGIWTNVSEVLATRFVFFCQTAVIRRNTLRMVGRFDEKLKVHEDYDFALRLALVESCKWVFTSEPLTIYQESFGSLSQEALREQIEMRQCEIRMREGVLTRLQARHDLRRFKRLMGLELRRSYFGLWVANLSRSRYPATRAIAVVLSIVDRYYRAIYRRTPWYPVFEARTIDDAPNAT